MKSVTPTKPDRTGAIVVLIFGVFFTILAVTAILAPVFEQLEWHFLSQPIYFIGGFLCHQMYTRSLHLFDLQTAVCTRDLFMYISMMLSAFLTVRFKVKRLPFLIAASLILPAALDGGIQLVSSLGWVSGLTYHSTNLMRAITGSLYGSGLGFFLFPLLIEPLEQPSNSHVL